MTTRSLTESPDAARDDTSGQHGDVSYQRIIRVSLPMVASAVVAVVMQVVVLALIGHMGGSALYVRSVYTPVSYLFLAMTTSRRRAVAAPRRRARTTSAASPARVWPSSSCSAGC